MTREEIVAAVKALLAAVDVEAFELGDSELRTISRPYVVIHLSARDASATPSVDGTTDLRGWRLQLRAASRVVGAVGAQLDAAYGALYGAWLTDNLGRDVAQISVEEGLSEDPPRPDGTEWFTADAEYTFTA